MLDFFLFRGQNLKVDIRANIEGIYQRGEQLQMLETETVSYKQGLLDRLNKKTAVIGVVGLGYVGLPLAVEKAKAGFNVIGFDVVESRVEQVNQGDNYIGDVEDIDLMGVVLVERRLSATTDFSKLSMVDAVIICVPTPLDRYMQPDMTYITSAVDNLAENLDIGTLVVLESTTYPGTTQEIIVPRLEARGWNVGQDVFIAYSPERVDPGNLEFKTKNTPKVVGGVTPNCTEIAATLYRNVLEGEVHEVSSPAVAEMEKIFENTFRNINIALANEMAVLCEKMGIDVWEVINAAKTKPYGFMAFYPGPGLGGHCIPIDPFYLTWKAREYNYHTRLIEVAGEINNSMPEYVVGRMVKLLNEQGKALNGSKVAIMGVAYKKDIEDIRESPVLGILDILDKAGADFIVVDPHVQEFRLNGRIIKTTQLLPEALSVFDVVALTTDHSSFNYEGIAEHSTCLFDTRNAFAGMKINGRYEKI